MEISTPKPTWIELSIRLSPTEALEIARELGSLRNAPKIAELCGGIIGDHVIPSEDVIVRQVPTKVYKKKRYSHRGKYARHDDLDKIRKYTQKIDKPYIIPTYLQQNFDMSNGQAIRTLDSLARRGELVRKELGGRKKTWIRYYIPGSEPVEASSEPQPSLKPPLPAEVRSQTYLCSPNSPTYDTMRDMTARPSTMVIGYDMEEEKIQIFLTNEALKVINGMAMHPLLGEHARAHYTALLEDIRIRFKQLCPHANSNLYNGRFENAFLTHLAPMVFDKLEEENVYTGGRCSRKLTTKDIAIIIANAFALPLDDVKNKLD